MSRVRMVIQSAMQLNLRYRGTTTVSSVPRRWFSRSVQANRQMFTVSDSQSFMNKVLNSDVPVIVNFHAEWCEPCKMLTPKLEELVVPLPGVDLAVVDVETCPDLVHAFEVKAVPAVIAVYSGLVVDKFIGLVDAQVIEDFIKRLAQQHHPGSNNNSSNTNLGSSNTLTDTSTQG